MRRRTNGAILFLVAALGVLGAHGDLDPSNGDAESSIPSESLGKPAPAPRPYPYPASAPAKKPCVSSFLFIDLRAEYIIIYAAIGPPLAPLRPSATSPIYLLIFVSLPISSNHD
jgi:hypothetical protein